MRVIIYYVDFHWDNYQGGSGKSFELTYHLIIPDGILAGEFWSFVHAELDRKIEKERPFKQNNAYSILSVEVQ